MTDTDSDKAVKLLLSLAGDEARHADAHDRDCKEYAAIGDKSHAGSCLMLGGDARERERLLRLAADLISPTTNPKG